MRTIIWANENYEHRTLPPSSTVCSNSPYHRFFAMALVHLLKLRFSSTSLLPSIRLILISLAIVQIKCNECAINKQPLSNKSLDLLFSVFFRAASLCTTSLHMFFILFTICLFHLNEQNKAHMQRSRAEQSLFGGQEKREALYLEVFI